MKLIEEEQGAVVLVVVGNVGVVTHVVFLQTSRRRKKDG
jgi:hypothetical protein